MPAPFTNFGRLFRGLNPLASFVEAGGLAEAVSRPLGTQIASYLDDIGIDGHPIFDFYSGPIQKRLRSPDLEERVHGLRQFQLGLQVGGADRGTSTDLARTLREPERKGLRKTLAQEYRQARRVLASLEPGAHLPRDTGFEGRIRSWLAGASNSDENIGKLRLWCIVSQDLHAARRLYAFRRTHMDWHAGYTDLTAVVRPRETSLGWFFLSALAEPCADKYDVTRLRQEIYTMIRLTDGIPRLRALALDAILMYMFHCRDWIPFLVLRQGAVHAAGEGVPEDISLAIGHGVHIWLLSVRTFGAFQEFESCLAGHFAGELTLDSINVLAAIALNRPNPVTAILAGESGDEIAQSARKALMKIADARDDVRSALKEVLGPLERVEGF
ncbi:MAG TPA: hypothetical protein VLJ37_06490 [bacterium]|nr:hypothetical protein [bacterium]